MDLGLGGRACVVTGAGRGIGRATARMLCAEGAGAARRPHRGASWSRRPTSAAARAPAAGGRAAPLVCDVTEADAGERIVRRGRGALRLARRARQQRRRRQLARPRRRPRGGLVRRLGAERDGADAADARRRAGDARARLGPRRQRRLHRRQAALGGDGRVLGREGRRALALAPLRRPLRRRRRSRQRDLPRARSSRRCGWPRAACSTSRRSTAATTAATRPSTPPASKRPIGRLAEVEEIASVIAFLCSERASYVAGAAWSVDGGTVQVII